jgi:hypothetical protein
LFGNFRRDSSAYAGEPALDVEGCVHAHDIRTGKSKGKEGDVFFIGRQVD